MKFPERKPRREEPKRESKLSLLSKESVSQSESNYLNKHALKSFDKSTNSSLQKKTEEYLRMNEKEKPYPYDLNSALNDTFEGGLPGKH